MAISNLQLIVGKTWRDLFKGKQNLIITIIVLLFCMLSIGIGFTKYTDSFSKIKEYREEVREHWEHRPDKHPHRMAHYGYLVFRIGHPLNVFDSGLDDYLGNVIFLEAHNRIPLTFRKREVQDFDQIWSFQQCLYSAEHCTSYYSFSGIRINCTGTGECYIKNHQCTGASGRDIIWGKILGLWLFPYAF